MINLFELLHYYSHVFEIIDFKRVISYRLYDNLVFRVDFRQNYFIDFFFQAIINVNVNAVN